MKCQCPTRLKHRVTIEQPTYAQDSSNEQIATWSTYSTQYAYCRPMGARDVVQAEQVLGAGNWIIELNKSSTTMQITSGMRARWTDGREIVADFDGPAMPMAQWPKRVQVKAVEQTA